jgi:hypothetical protein
MNQDSITKLTLEVARDWLEAFNRGDWEIFNAQLHPKVIFTQRKISSVDHGVEDVFSSFQDWRAGHSDLNGHIIDGFEHGDRAVLEVHWMGTKVNGEAVDFYACLLFKARDEKLIEIVDYY